MVRQRVYARGQQGLPDTIQSTQIPNCNGRKVEVAVTLLSKSGGFSSDKNSYSKPIHSVRGNPADDGDSVLADIGRTGLLFRLIAYRPVQVVARREKNVDAKSS